MRKVIWCCSVAGVLSAVGFLSLAYYACRCPDSLVGRSMQVIAEASVAMQPLNGITSLARHSSQTNTADSETAGSVEECIPDDPQPIAPEPTGKVVTLDKIEVEAAPIVIGEEESMPREEAAPVVVAPLDGSKPKGCPIIMPYCQDDGDKPIVLGTGDEKSSSEDAEGATFKEWMKLFNTSKKDKSSPTEELPAPVEEPEPQAEPKCQEDIHLHEHYPGCPRVTCPYTGKSERSCTPVRKSGTEEASEEPPHEKKKLPRLKVGKTGEDELPAPNVDTMEYRKSDAGLNEYGPGPLQ